MPFRARATAICKSTRREMSLFPSKNKSHLFGITQKNRRLPRLPGNTIMKACMHTHHDTSPNTKTAGMEIIDREREKEWLEQMDTILIFVCHTCLWRLVELIGCSGCTVRRFLERFPHRTPPSSRTGPYGYHTGCSDLPDANDA